MLRVEYHYPGDNTHHIYVLSCDKKDKEDLASWQATDENAEIAKQVYEEMITALETDAKTFDIRPYL